MKKEKEYFEKAKKELIIDTHRFEILTDDQQRMQLIQKRDGKIIWMLKKYCWVKVMLSFDYIKQLKDI